MRKLYIVGDQKKGSDEAKRYYFKAHDALKAGKWIKVLQYLRESIRIKPDYQAALRELAEIYHQRGDAQEARKYIERAISIDPNDPISLFIQGVITIGRGEIEPALEYFKRSEKNGELTWGLAYNIGLCHYCLGDFGASIKYLNNALLKDPSQPHPYMLLAQIFIRQDQKGMAKDILAKAKRMRPNDRELDIWISDIINHNEGPEG